MYEPEPETDDSFDDEVAKYMEAGNALKRIKERCDVAKIKYEDDSNTAASYIDFTVQIPCGRETRSLYMGDPDDVLRFAAIPFERYTFLGNYAAIACYEEGVIEAVISAPTSGITILTRNRIRNVLGIHRAQSGSAPLLLKSSDIENPLTISIRNVSALARILNPTTNSLGLSLEIRNATLATQEDALELLQKISHSLFFSIDLQKGIFLILVRVDAKRKREMPYENNLEIQYPAYVYDKAPMELYWYARSATKMPLLQFLAFYQVLEFYYPTFFSAEISRRIRSQIKNPAFRVDSEADLARIVSIIKTKGPGSGSEREQLKATLKECIENDDIENFLKTSKERRDFFSSKAKGITSCLINLENKGTELYIQAAERIYSIRCKIVHTKGEENEAEVELLLPNSKEAEKLDEDIELVRFIAQKVMVCASKGMNL